MQSCGRREQLMRRPWVLFEADTLQWAMYSVDWENTRRYVSAWDRSCGSCAAFNHSTRS